MLVIRRKTGESIRIGADVEVEIIECAPNRVKLGIKAPREVTVMRSEVLMTGEQNRRAAGSIARLADLRSILP